MVEVSLSFPELLLAAQVGTFRQVSNTFNKRKPGNNHPDDLPYYDHFLGAIGEYVVAKWLGIFWSGSIGNMRAADVGPYEVKLRSKHYYDLVLQRHNSADALYILVTGLGPEFIIQGGLWGHDGKQDNYWGEKGTKGRPAFWIPQEDLMTPSQIKEIVIARTFAPEH